LEAKLSGSGDKLGESGLPRLEESLVEFLTTQKTGEFLFRTCERALLLLGELRPETSISEHEGALKELLGLSPGVRQTDKTLPAVRWNSIVLRTGFPARWPAAGEAEAGNAGEQPAEE
jgi:hypothetical protein